MNLALFLSGKHLTGKPPAEGSKGGKKEFRYGVGGSQKENQHGLLAQAEEQVLEDVVCEG